MKKREITWSITILLLAGLFLISNLLPDIREDADIGGRAVSAPASLRIVIIPVEDAEVPASGNVTFSDDEITEFIELVEGLEEGSIITARMYGNAFPHDWYEPEPSEDEVETAFRYFELNSNNDTGGDRSYWIYFNLYQDVMETTNPNDVRMFAYESGWDELPTAVLHASDPVAFSATTTHFSKFVVGTRAASSEEPATSPGTGGGGGDGGGGGCSYRWECTEWRECMKEGVQKRICEYAGSCRIPDANPYPVEQKCKYIPQKRGPEEEPKEEAETKGEASEGRELPKKPESEKPSWGIVSPPQTAMVKAGIIISLIIVGIILIKRKKDITP